MLCPFREPLSIRQLPERAFLFGRNKSLILYVSELALGSGLVPMDAKKTLPDIPSLPMLWPLASLVGGMLLDAFCPCPPWAYSLGLALSLLLFIRAHNGRGLGQVLQRARTTGLCFCFVSLGALLAWEGDDCRKGTWYGHQLERASHVTLQLEDRPEARGASHYARCRVTHMLVNDRWRACTGMIKTYWRPQPGLSLHKGQRWVVPNDLKPIGPEGWPQGFDPVRYAALQGLYHQGYFRHEKAFLLNTGASGHGRIDRWRGALRDLLSERIKDDAALAIMGAILINEKGQLPEEQRASYSATGIVHILAISGMHVSMLFSLLRLLFRWGRSWSLQRLQWGLALPLIVLYVAITDFPPSAVRAAAMFCLAALGQLSSQQGHPLNRLATSGLAMLLYRPQWLYHIGAQLSFLAVLSILLFLPPLQKKYRSWHWAPRYCMDSIAISVAAQILTAPLVAYYFHQFPVPLLLASLPAALFSAVLMAGSLVFVGLSACGLPMTGMAASLELTCSLFNDGILMLARLQPAWASSLHLSGGECALLALTGCCSGLALCHAQKRWALPALFLCLGLQAKWLLQELRRNEQEMTIVYPASGKAILERIKGRIAFRAYPKDIADGPDRYTGYAHRAMGIAATRPYEGTYWETKGKRLLYLRRLPRKGIATRQEVDYLLVHGFREHEGEALSASLGAGCWIVMERMPAERVRRWRERLRPQGTRLHYVPEDGIWTSP